MASSIASSSASPIASSIVIAVPTVGAGLALQDALRRAGAQATWCAEHADGPGAAPPHAAVVVLDADHLGARLPEVAGAWRATAA